MNLLHLFRFFYLIGASFALFFSILVFSKKNSTLADKILGAWLIILFTQLFIPFLYLADINVYYQYAGYEITLYVFHPFLLYLYVKTTIGNLPNRRVIIWNAIIILVSEISGLSFLIFPPEERLLFIKGKEFLPLIYLPMMVIMLGYFTFNICYSYKLLKDYKNDVLQVYSYRENVDLLWLRRLVMLFAGISILIFPLGLISYYVFHSIVFADYFFFVALVVFVFFLGYWGYQQGQVFSFNNEPIPLDDDKVEDITSTNIEQPVPKNYKKEAKHLQEIMKSKKPFLEPTLTIHDLARLTDMPPHQLSKVINKEFHSNFFELINNYRIEEFKQKAFMPGYKNLTILGIALECGFNSKSAFNRIFKETTGITPGDFIKNHKP